MDETGTISYEDFLAWVRGYAGAIAENRQYLTELDSAIGDADHGTNMDRGFQAVLGKLAVAQGSDIGAAAKTIGMTLISTVGGASGPLYGTFFLQLATATTGRDAISLQDWLAGMEAGIAGIQRLGKAEPGDKTMLETLLPARDALRGAFEQGQPPEVALATALGAAEEGMKSTIPLVARKGRASYLGERSAGHQDPGATSSYLLIKAAADAWIAGSRRPTAGSEFDPATSTKRG